MSNSVTGRVSITIEAPATAVWEALTNPKWIKQYFFGTDTTTDWKVGSSVTFDGVHEGKSYHDKGTVLAKKTHKMLRYSYWSSLSGVEDKPENYVTVTYQLEEKDGRTELTIIQENIKDDKMKAHAEENWNMVLGKLKDLVEEQHVSA